MLDAVTKTSRDDILVLLEASDGRVVTFFLLKAQISVSRL